jgi:formylglycine-generating enzyme required for sulfatase activity
MDVTGIAAGAYFERDILEAVRRCDVLLVVIGNEWLSAAHEDGPLQGRLRLDDPNDYVRQELQTALGRGIPVIPILVGNATMPQCDRLPASLATIAQRNATEVRGGRDFHTHILRLIADIEKCAQSHIGETPVAPPSGPVWEGVSRMPFVHIPSGTSILPSILGDRAPRHISDFYMGKFPVTQGEWAAVMGSNPSSYSRNGLNRDAVRAISNGDLDRFPVECVSFIEVESFVLLLNERYPVTGWSYGLPSEPQWEYACRAQSSIQRMFHTGDTLTLDDANFDGVLGRPSKVGAYPPNAFGLHDMHGNVWEWSVTDSVYDETTPWHLIIRGGSWATKAEKCGSGSFWDSLADCRSPEIGFRLILSAL